MAESESKRLVDGLMTLEGGVHEGQHPTLLNPNQAARLLNATVRGGLVSCRPTVKRFPLRFQDGEQLEWFKTHNVQGRHVYRSPVGFPSLIVSVGGRIFKIEVTKPQNTNVIELTPVGDANPSVRPHVWMKQAEQYLIIQDGQSTPLIYDGATCRRSSLGAPLYEVPVGTAMAYGHGRLVVVRPHRRSYVIGDIVNGGTEVIQFTEENYLSEGGDVTVPIPGEITAVEVIAQIDRSTGQGDLVVFTPYGACSAKLGENRDTWKDIQFQLVALLGAGATSQNSVALANGDLFFRAEDGIRSLTMSQRMNLESWANTPSSRELNKTLSFDTPALLDFAEAAVFDNRLIMLCNQTPLVNGCYHRRLAVLDFDVMSGMALKLPPVYDGTWHGLRATAIVSGAFPSGERCFIFHRNSDGENELWELHKGGALDNDINRIIWRVESPALLKSSTSGEPLMLKMLTNGDISLEQMEGKVRVVVEYLPDQAPCWFPWRTFDFCARTEDCSACQPQGYRPQYRTKRRFGQPPDDCEESDFKPSRLGYNFQVRVTITGKAAIRSLRLIATEVDEVLNGADESEDSTETLPTTSQDAVVTTVFVAVPPSEQVCPIDCPVDGGSP